MDSNLKEEPKKPKMRCPLIFVGECARQGNRGKWQILLEILLPMILALYFVSCISYLYN